jgi:hypothetical protein
MTIDRTHECYGDPGIINAEEPRRSLEDAGYLGMLLTASADMASGWEIARVQASENRAPAYVDLEAGDLHST